MGKITQRRPWIIVVFALIILFGMPNAACSEADPDPVPVFIDPAESTARTCDEHTIALRVEEVNNLTAYHLEISFDPAVVEVLEVKNGDFLIEPDDVAYFYEPNNTIDNETGLILFGMAQQGVEVNPEVMPQSGDGDLIYITMRAVSPDRSTEFTIDADESFLVEWPGVSPINFSAADGVVYTQSCAPTDIRLSNQTVLEFQPAGTPVGTFSTVDPAVEDDVFFYTLIQSGDHASFHIVGDQLNTAEEFSCELKNSYTITVRSTDPRGKFVEKEFTIEVTWVPIAEPDEYTIAWNTSLLMDAPGVLGNDYAPTAFKQHLTSSLVVGEGPSHGTLVLNPNGSLAYSPDQDFSGEDSFLYQACHNSLCSQAVKVTITVSKVPVVIYFPLITR